MAKLIGREGSWELDHFHQWKDRSGRYVAPPAPIVSPSARVATIGSCFASELARGISRLGIAGAMHPTGLFYNTSSIRQEIERVFGGWPEASEEPLWELSGGWAHPFKDASMKFPSPDELLTWSDGLDKAAAELFRTADIIVITLGLIETWRNERTGNVFRVLPPPEIFSRNRPAFERLTVSQMLSDLHRIRQIIRANTKAEIVVTVSPVPLHATMTDRDVRIANTESKSRIRAAVSEFVDECPDVNYFHSYELVSTAERMSDFMEADGRHVRRRAVDYILSEFVRTFGNGLSPAEVDTSWITLPEKTAARPAKRPIVRIVNVIPKPIRRIAMAVFTPAARGRIRGAIGKLK